MLCALMYRQNGDLANLLKSARKKSAPECPFECGGGGGNRYLGNAQIEVTLTLLGLPLQITFSLSFLRPQNIKTSLYAISKNVSVLPFFLIFMSVREKLQFTVSFDHPVIGNFC